MFLRQKTSSIPLAEKAPNNIAPPKSVQSLKRPLPTELGNVGEPAPQIMRKNEKSSPAILSVASIPPQLPALVENLPNKDQPPVAIIPPPPAVTQSSLLHPVIQFPTISSPPSYFPTVPGLSPSTERESIQFYHHETDESGNATKGKFAKNVYAVF